MPDIPNRDELERKIARLLGRFNKTQLGDLLEMMGNSPKMNKIPPSFWTESEQALAAELVPFSEMVYLEAAERVVDSVPLPIGFDWTLVNQDAADWAISKVGKLVTEITDTTRKRIGGAVANYFREVQTIGDLELSLSEMVDRFENILGPKRAEMIAVTEITRAASQGELGVARQLKNEGIEMRKVWQTNKDDLVCTICEPLQSTEESTWRSVAPDGPPAHVRCRCFLSLLLPRVTGEGQPELTDVWQPSMSREQAEQWAKDSEYKDTLYHGTTNEGLMNIPREGFDLSRKTTGRMYGDGVYFTTNESTARSYGNVLESKINIKNPYNAKSSFEMSKLTDEGMKWYKTLPAESKFELESYNDLLTRYLKHLGHDSVIMEGEKIAVVFDPKNIAVIK